MSGNVILVFGRLPVAGKVKTRLTKGLNGNSELSCEFYKCCAEHIIEQSVLVPNTKVIFFYSDTEDKEKVEEWLKEKDLLTKLTCNPQKQVSGLGERMDHAFQWAFETLNPQKVIIIGTDVPSLNAEVMTKAFESLNSFDVVLGDSGDGGYYLLGKKKYYSFLFKDIVYSTSSVIEETIKKANSNGLNVSPTQQLPTLIDIDYIDDMKEWVKQQKQLIDNNNNNNNNDNNTFQEINFKTSIFILCEKILLSIT